MVFVKDEFLLKLKNNEYISERLYNDILDNFKEYIPLNFDLDEYNRKVISIIYLKNKSFFDNMYKDIDPNIKLDMEQIGAIIADEDYSLIIAGAGTGKTTTMASKVKYLVDIMKVEPSKILVMSYTKKSTKELADRINIDFGIPARVLTFHSLGFEYIREIFKGHKCYVVDENIKDNIFLEFFDKNVFSNKEVLREFFDIFDAESTCKNWLFGDFLKENYNRYNTYFEMFNAFKESKIRETFNLENYIKERLEREVNQEVVRTIKGEIVKSKGEGIIANYLFMHGIDYSYEKIFPELVGNNQVYRPDFTINYNGEEIYIEYFGLSNYKDNELNRYEKNKKRKIEYHNRHNTNFIQIDYMPSENIIETLEEGLRKYGISPKMISYEDIYSAMLDRFPLTLIYPLRDLFYEVIDAIKSSPNRKDYAFLCKSYLTSLKVEERVKAKKQFHYIEAFYYFYQERLFGNPNSYGFDFPDMIYYAREYIANVKSNELDFKYIIIDEYQDISLNNYELTKSIVKVNGAKIVAVGDDWQSIYAFNGSKIEYIYNFQKYFPYSKILNITKTYRNSQELINYSGEFIMRNEEQIRKDLISNKSTFRPIRFIPFEENEEYSELKKQILRIHSENPDHSILILGRTNKIIDSCFKDPGLKDAIGTKVEFVGYEDIDIDAMTIHKSKGLTSDEVIIIGLDNTFPSSNYSKFWLTDLFSNKVDYEGIAYPEERRIFYVGLTRTKNYVYLLVNKNPKLRSPFIRELWEIIHSFNV